MAQNRIPIVIADDHAVLRESLTALLQSQPEFDVVGGAANGEEALRLVQQHAPQVLVLDLAMPGGDGFEVLRTLERAGSRVASVVLTGSENQNDYVQVVRLGARGLVLKADKPEKLFAAIRAVADGELAFSDEIAHIVLDAMVSNQPRVPSSMARLSERERQDFLHGGAGDAQPGYRHRSEHQRKHREAPPAEHLFQDRLSRSAGAGGACAECDREGSLMGAFRLSPFAIRSSPFAFRQKATSPLR